MYQSRRSLNIPPRATPLEFCFQIPPFQGENLFKRPIIGQFQVIKCPHPGKLFSSCLCKHGLIDNPLTCQRWCKWFLNTFKYRAKLVQAFAFQPVRRESGIFRFECIKACLRHRHDLSRLVESERHDVNETEASDQISHPLWVVIKFPAPGKTKFIKFPPSRAEKDIKCLGYARGDVWASIWRLVHNSAHLH